LYALFSTKVFFLFLLIHIFSIFVSWFSDVLITELKYIAFKNQGSSLNYILNPEVFPEFSPYKFILINSPFIHHDVAGITVVLQ